MATEKVISALEEVVKKRFPVEQFCVSGYQEEAICLQYEDGYWIIFIGERGNRYNMVKCDTVLLASLEFIRKLTSRKEDISEMESELVQIIAKAA